MVPASNNPIAAWLAILPPYPAATMRETMLPCNKRSEVRQFLAGFAPTREFSASSALDQLGGVADRVALGRVDIAQLAPGDRRRDRCAFAGAGDIREHRGRAALVAQIVNEDLALARDFLEI